MNDLKSMSDEELQTHIDFLDYQESCPGEGDDSDWAYFSLMDALEEQRRREK